VVLTSAEASIQLAESMEARGFGSAVRTSYERRRLTSTDWLVVTASGLAVVGFIAAHAAGHAAEWDAYPSLVAPRVDVPAVVSCLFLFAPVLVWRRRA
jgi:energy-coupling factor transport system permease protein